MLAWKVSSVQTQIVLFNQIKSRLFALRVDTLSVPNVAKE